MSTTKRQRKTKSFHVNLHCVILATNISANKAYVLSTNSKEIKLPFFALTSDHKNDTTQFLIDSLRENYIYVHELELLPQIISIHNDILGHENNVLNVVYGFIVNLTNSVNNAYWIEFQYTDTNNKFLPLLTEVIQQLK
jgi:hypothetical protein